MRGTDEASGSLFSYVDLEERVPERHPLRLIRRIANDALASLDAEFDALYTYFGRPSIAPERLIRASLQLLFSVRSERQLMEQMDYNLLFRWFVGLGIDDPVWVPTVFTKNRDRPPANYRNSLAPDEWAKPDPASAAAMSHLQTVAAGKTSFNTDFFSSLLSVASVNWFILLRNPS